MYFSPKFYYDDAANEGTGGAGASTETVENTGNEGATQSTEAAKETPIQAEVAKPIITDEEIKSYGFDSPEAFKTFLAKHKENSVSDEEKQQKENLEKANFLKFSAENKLLNVEEYNKFETLKARADKDLVFENFLSEYKADHPEITDAAELEEAAKEDFDYEYKQKEGSSESARKRGEAKLAREAKELRSPIENKVVAAQEQFKQNNNIRETYPKFEKFVDESIQKNTPDKTVLYKAKDGDKEIGIEIELTKADREAIAKDFKTPKTFGLFTTGKPEEIQAAIDKKMQGWIKLNKFDEVAAKSFEIGKGIGVKSGSNVGATNPYPFRQGSASENTGEETLEESNARIARLRKNAY